MRYHPGLPLLLLLIKRSYLLAMLKSAVSGRAILLVVVGLSAATVVLSLRLLRRVTRLLVSALVIATLLRRVWAVRLRWILLVVLWRTVLAVVLVVRAGHDEFVCDVMGVGKQRVNVPGQRV